MFGIQSLLLAIDIVVAPKTPNWDWAQEDALYFLTNTPKCKTPPNKTCTMFLGRQNEEQLFQSYGSIDQGWSLIKKVTVELQCQQEQGDACEEK